MRLLLALLAAPLLLTACPEKKPANESPAAEPAKPATTSDKSGAESDKSGAESDKKDDKAGGGW